MRSLPVNRAAVVWTVGSIDICYDSAVGRYVLVSDRGELATFQGKGALRQAWETAQGMIGGVA